MMLTTVEIGDCQVSQSGANGPLRPRDNDDVVSVTNVAHKWVGNRRKVKHSG